LIQNLVGEEKVERVKGEEKMELERLCILKLCAPTFCLPHCNTLPNKNFRVGVCLKAVRLLYQKKKFLEDANIEQPLG
jgi:hypothetical protein